MSDGAAAIIGVIVGGFITLGTSYGLVRRREKRDARAARLIIRSEFDEAATAISYAFESNKWPPGWTRKTWSHTWSTYRPVLALDMRDDDTFAAVASAYLYMGLLETGLAAEERAFIDTDQRFLCDTIKHINEAVADLLGADPAKAPPACSEIESTSATS